MAGFAENLSSRFKNADVHALSEHKGVSAYVTLDSFDVYLEDFPRRAYLTFLYQDKYGQELEKTNKKWENFSLNREAWEMLKGIILTNGIAQEAMYVLMQNLQK